MYPPSLVETKDLLFQILMHINCIMLGFMPQVKYICAYMRFQIRLNFMKYLRENYSKKRRKAKNTAKAELFHSFFPRTADEFNLGNSKYPHW